MYILYLIEEPQCMQFGDLAFFRWKDPWETQQYFPTFVDGKGLKARTRDLPQTERVYARLTN